MDSSLTSSKEPARVWFFLLTLGSLPYTAGDVWNLVVSWYRKHVRPPGRTPLRVHEKGETVSTLNEWKAVLAKDLLELQQLARAGCFHQDEALHEETGNWATLLPAGGSLGDPDLILLKEAIGLDEWQWHAYKSKVRPAHDY